MIVDEILAQEEGKNLEFKENAKSLQRIVQTVIAFANTAGGTLILGIRDKTKEVVGVENALDEEVRIANVISDLVRPLLVPNINLLTWRGKDLLVITVQHDRTCSRGIVLCLGCAGRKMFSLKEERIAVAMGDDCRLSRLWPPPLGRALHL